LQGGSFVSGRGCAGFDEHGRLLLIRENYGRERYGPPGGEIEAGELLLEAVVREFREETWADFEVEGLVGVYHFVHGCTRPRPGMCRRIGLW
jgi:ADP-ribose pyrophosphatase YjhB (NUDIX family)